MTQMLEGPPDAGPALPPEEQWTDWGRTQVPAGPPKPPSGFFRASVIVPLAVLTGLIVLGGLFLVIAAPAGAAGVCGGG